MTNEEQQRIREAVEALLPADARAWQFFARHAAPVEPWVYDMAARVNAAAQANRARRHDSALALMEDVEARVGRMWRERIIEHLVRQRDRELRDGLPQKPPTGDEAFHAFMRDQGEFVSWCAQALEFAAKALKDAGKGHQAGQVYQAHLKAKERAKGLLGDV